MRMGPQRESRGSVPGPAPLSYEGVWRFTAPAVDVSVPRTRRAVRDLLERRRVPAGEAVVGALLLILSELVTNAVRHAAVVSPEIAVEVGVGAGWLRVCVEDRHPYRPTVLEADPERTGGRGLLLVREITQEAGGGFDIERTADGGKAVRAILPFEPSATVPGPVGTPSRTTGAQAPTGEAPSARPRPRAAASHDAPPRAVPPPHPVPARTPRDLGPQRRDARDDLRERDPRDRDAASWGGVTSPRRTP